MKYKKEIDEFYTKVADLEEFQPIKAAIERIIDGFFVEGKVPKDALGLSQKTMEAFYTQAYQNYKAGRYNEALKIFRILSALDPTVLKYIMGMASCFHMKKDYVRAATMYHVCGSADPTDPVPYYHLSDCYAKMGLADASVECLRLVLKYAKGKPCYKEIIDRAKFLVKKSVVQNR